MFLDPWFWAFVLTALVLCFTLAKNYTNGPALWGGLQGELIKLRAEWEAHKTLTAAAMVEHKANTNALLTANGVNTNAPRMPSST
jgi:hypothetical protein